MCVRVHVPVEAKKGTGSIGAGVVVTLSCYVCAGTNSGPPWEHCVLLTVLHPHIIVFLNKKQQHILYPEAGHGLQCDCFL